ncbi:hypothetical protein F383_20709 [Gossypium arboreum]|uniref:Uncharacterized protein n=1 Tax=Gossypium arboreum TaxID=29729 RepID=A0A0B0NR55_GOSAR|nr:hypothetical protein F383_20709 [Gossypium arboreum]
MPIRACKREALSSHVTGSSCKLYNRKLF